jgi:hypothetical protein
MCFVTKPRKVKPLKLKAFTVFDMLKLKSKRFDGAIIRATLDCAIIRVTKSECACNLYIQHTHM